MVVVTIEYLIRLVLALFIISLILFDIAYFVYVTNNVTYNLSELVRRANEKIKIVAVTTSQGTLIGIRNFSLRNVTLKEYGIIDIYGKKTVLGGNKALLPGESIRLNTAPTLGAVYIITSSGNLFVRGIINLLGGYNEQTIQLVSLFPSIYSIPSPVKYNYNISYNVSLNTIGYVFGFLVFASNNTSDSYTVIFGPYRVYDLFLSGRTNISKSDYLVFPNTTFTYTFSFQISKTGYFVGVDFNVSRTNGTGLSVYGCVGFMWEIVSNEYFTYSISSNSAGSCSYGVETICDMVKTLVSPTISPSAALVSYLSNIYTQSYPLDVPSGSVAYILYTKCFKIVSPTSSSIYTINKTIQGYNVYTYLLFPGATATRNGVVYTSFIPLTVKIDPEAIITLSLERW